MQTGATANLQKSFLPNKRRPRKSHAPYTGARPERFVVIAGVSTSLAPGVMRNIRSMLVTLKVSQKAIRWLKATAVNMRVMDVTLEVSQLSIGWSKAVLANMPLMIVTVEVSQCAIGWLKARRVNGNIRMDEESGRIDPVSSKLALRHARAAHVRGQSWRQQQMIDK